METSTGKPYTEIIGSGCIIRAFDSDVDEQDLVWHRDYHTRLITIDHANGWQFQFENELPFKLVDGMIFLVERETYHRLIKGTGQLILKIRE